MKSTGELKKELLSTENELRILREYIRQNGFTTNDNYSNPRTGNPPAGTEDYLFRDRIYTLIGKIEALNFSLSKSNIKYS